MAFLTLGLMDFVPTFKKHFENKLRKDHENKFKNQ
jgi:hypothetical protein